MTDEELTKKLTKLIIESIQYKRWLYWPPGPMMGQVIDTKRIEADISRLIKENK